LLIFDEPLSGLDPINAELLRNIILELRGEGKTILFASHRMEQVERICDDICLIAEGAAIVSGSLRDVKRAAGRNIVEVEFEGNGEFVDHLTSFESIDILDQKVGMVRLRLGDTRLAGEVLDLARQDVDILRFEIMEPSLNEIFVDRVGAHARERAQWPEEPSA
jgi:ABC-2 type transport system ATP-binding protein